MLQLLLALVTLAVGDLSLCYHPPQVPNMTTLETSTGWMSEDVWNRTSLKVTVSVLRLKLDVLEFDISGFKLQNC